jgi:hypothetical protein
LPMCFSTALAETTIAEELRIAGAPTFRAYRTR